MKPGVCFLIQRGDESAQGVVCREQANQMKEEYFLSFEGRPSVTFICCLATLQFIGTRDLRRVECWSTA